MPTARAPYLVPLPLTMPDVAIQRGLMRQVRMIYTMKALGLKHSQIFRAGFEQLCGELMIGCWEHELSKSQFHRLRHSYSWDME